jgi:UPF0176 protein
MQPDAAGFVVSTFYHFTHLSHLDELQLELHARAAALEITGTILLAPEGINATIAGRRSGIESFLTVLGRDPRFVGLTTKESSASGPPFDRLKVRLKKEIVALGRPDISPLNGVGSYVPPKEWNALISDPDTIVVDTRNHFEVRIGTFERAVDPNTRDFREFSAWAQEALSPHRHKRIAMFCTGGIRCEKATALLVAEGYENVFHLEGGILKYLEQVPEQESLWRGDCFVFDRRVALTHGLKHGSHVMCERCGEPYPKSESECPRCPTIDPTEPQPK